MRILLVPLIFLASSATATAAVSTAPSATYNTSKAPQAIASCLEKTFGPLSLVRNGKRASISFRDAEPGLALVITDRGKVEVWRSASVRETLPHVQSCV